MTSRTTSALVSGAATVVYYASPDFLASRTARGWVKAGVAAVSLATAVPELRAARAAARARREAGEQGQPSPAFGSLPAATRAALLGAAAAVAVLSVRGAVAAERWAFRRGEERAAAGRRLPHTGPALLYGALTTALGLLPSSSSGTG
ncbi:hypothetical protein [Blastococcus sp. SYSU D00820]